MHFKVTNLLYFGWSRMFARHGQSLALAAEEREDFSLVGDQKDAQGPHSAGCEQEGAGGSDMVILFLKD